MWRVPCALRTALTDLKLHTLFQAVSCSVPVLPRLLVFPQRQASDKRCRLPRPYSTGNAAARRQILSMVCFLPTPDSTKGPQGPSLAYMLLFCLPFVVALSLVAAASIVSEKLAM